MPPEAFWGVLERPGSFWNLLCGWMDGVCDVLRLAIFETQTTTKKAGPAERPTNK